jgi:APA family basic amino acid/polyamine antiporter
MVAIAVFAIYFTLPLVALSALPVHEIAGRQTTLLALTPEQGGFQNDPILGVVEHLGISGAVLSALKVYVGILAATILFIATNAGIIGASRITYSMATYRQLPSAFRRLHPRFKTPWLSLIVFAGIVSIVVLIPGQVGFLSTMYSFGAMLSFTVAHVSLIQLRRRHAQDEFAFEAKPNLSLRGVNWPIFAFFGGTATALAWLVVVLQSPSTRYAGLGWLVLGFAVYYVYRRRVLGVPLTETVRAPVEIGPAEALEYANILVPVAAGYPSDEAMDVACRLARERRSRIVAVTVIEMPLELPLDAYLPERVAEANEQLDEARAIAESYGVNIVTRLIRARNAGRAIVDEAIRRNSQIIVMGGPRRIRLQSGRRAIFGDTVDFVLRHAPCRVMVAAGRAAA